MEYFKETHIEDWKTIQEFCIASWNGEFTDSKVFQGAELEYLTSIIEANVAPFKVKSILMFINRPGFVQDIHVDGFKVSRKNSSNTALNIPIQNCNESPMIWYKGNYSLSESTSNTIKYLNVNWTSGPDVDVVHVIDKPTIVRINTPHRIENHSNAPRLMLSVRFTQDLHLG